MTETLISGVGLATRNDRGEILDVWYPEPHFGPIDDADAACRERLSAQLGRDERRAVDRLLVEETIELQEEPASTSDAYLRLHALSHLLVAPNGLSLDGIFAHLPNNAWTSAGPMSPADVPARHSALREAGIVVRALDKFPALLDYVIPPGVRIADGARVRLGAHLAPGTTVMHEGFVNFNAGTLGPGMVEGRISQGVVVGAGSDIGGGASIMGTLSGGGEVRVSIGERTLLGANAGIGISLGDDCIVEAGLYITASSKVVLADAPAQADGSRPVVKALELSGRSGLLYRRNSLTGTVEAIERARGTSILNDALHA